MSEFKFTEDDLAQEIRRIDGNHNLGAGLLAEKLFEFIEGKHPAPAESDKEAVRNSALEEVLEWLETEVTAIDTWYRGDPSYEYDAGYMKDRVMNLLNQAKVAFKEEHQSPAESDNEAVRNAETDDERKAFERHWYEHYHSGSIQARSDGTYFNKHVQCSWEAWQARASLKSQQAQPTVNDSIAQGIAETISNGDGIWRSCSGCHELNEGHATGTYSDIFKCHLGGGCSECGGIGAIWDDTDYAAMGDSMAKSMQPAQPSDSQAEVSDSEMLDWMERHRAEIEECREGWKVIWIAENGDVLSIEGEHCHQRDAIKAAMQPQKDPS